VPAVAHVPARRGERLEAARRHHPLKEPQQHRPLLLQLMPKL
jgi:hypothetical protein